MRDRSQRSRTLALVLAATMALAILWRPYLKPFGQALSGTQDRGRFGQIDFVEYWSAAQVLAHGGNPYDPAEMSKAQSLEDPKSQPLMMWNPPWMVLLLAPIIKSDLSTSAHTWLLINIAMIFSIAFIARRLYPLAHFSELAACIVTFPPLWETLKLGQIGILLALAATVAWWALSRGRFFLAGIALAFLSLKPHLVLIAGVVLFWYDCRFARMRICCGVLFALTILIGFTEFTTPGSSALWLSAMTNMNEIKGAVGTQYWVTTSLPSAAKSILAQYLGGLTPGFVYLITSLMMLAALWAAIQRARRIEWRADFPQLIGFSVMFAPFGWFFDQALLLPSALRAAAYNPAPIVIFNALTAYVLVNYVQYQHQLFWFPIGVLLLSIYSTRSNER